jgi:hypothetical protein
LFDKFFNI